MTLGQYLPQPISWGRTSRIYWRQQGDTPATQSEHADLSKFLDVIASLKVWQRCKKTLQLKMIQIMRFQDKSVISTPVVWFLISLFRKWSVEVKISKFTVTCPTLGHGSGEANSPIPVFLAPADCDSASVHCADWQHNKIHCQKHGWEQKIISSTEAETILHLISSKPFVFPIMRNWSKIVGA